MSLTTDLVIRRDGMAFSKRLPHKPLYNYVYFHRKSTDNSIFYVGKGKNWRAWDTSRGRNKHWKNTASKYGVFVEIVKEGMTECCALTYEKILINRIGIEYLTNLTNGGEGSNGYIPNNETRLKMSIAKKGISRGPLPIEIRDKIRKSHYGIRPNEDALIKMRASKSGQRTRELNNKFKPEILSFSHIDGMTFNGCIYDFRRALNIGASCVSSIISGKQRTAKGWSYIGPVIMGELIND